MGFSRKFVVLGFLAVLFVFGAYAAYASAPDVAYDITIVSSSTKEQMVFELLSNRSSWPVLVKTPDGVVHTQYLSVASMGGKWYSWLNLEASYGVDDGISVYLYGDPAQRVSLCDWRDSDGDGWYQWLPLHISSFSPDTFRPGGVITLTGSFNEVNPAGAMVRLDYKGTLFPETAKIQSWMEDRIIAVLPEDVTPLERDGWSVFVGHWAGGYVYSYLYSNRVAVLFSGPNAITLRSLSAKPCWWIFCQ